MPLITVRSTCDKQNFWISGTDRRSEDIAIFTSPVAAKRPAGQGGFAGADSRPTVGSRNVLGPFGRFPQFQAPGEDPSNNRRPHAGIK